jgi:uridine kinase
MSGVQTSRFEKHSPAKERPTATSNSDHKVTIASGIVDWALATLDRTASPFALGITGADASGKSHLAEAIGAELKRRKRPYQIVHVDDFLRPRAIRYSGDATEVEKYLDQSFDLNHLVDAVLEPLRRNGSVVTTITHLDVITDRYEVERTYRADGKTLVVIEGVFLLRPDVRCYLDGLVFLDAPDDELRARGRRRDAAQLGPDADRRFREKYLPAQHRLFSLYPPCEHADVIIDNRDWRRPRITRWWGE